jgi:hypothetical protein
MPEGKKKKPAWLTGEPEETRVAGQQIPRTGNRTGGRKGPLAEDDTGELLAAGSAKTAVAEEDATANAEAQTNTIPRVGMPGAGSGASVEANAGRPNGTPNGGNSAREIFERLRENPMPLLGAGLALVVIIGVLVIVFGGGGGDPKTAERGPSEGAQDARQGAADPFAGGPVSDSGVAFEPLRESGGAASLSGAGLEWSGSVTEKGNGQGQTLTLDGPTAAQLERGFDIGDWDVEPGVYAVAPTPTPARSCTSPPRPSCRKRRSAPPRRGPSAPSTPSRRASLRGSPTTSTRASRTRTGSPAPTSARP